MTSVAPRRVVTLAILGMLGWTVALTASLTWELVLLRDQMVALGRFQAEGAFERDLAYRRWNADAGGVYADATRVEPNPYLEVEHRDLETAAGPLTMVNPAYMTRIVHGIAAEGTGITSHITSLRPIRPENAPAAWEAAALRGFEAGATVYTAVITAEDGEEQLRFMRPLLVEKPCLTCHEFQGYTVGDVRGGISVTVPLTPIAAILAPTRQASISGHAVAWLLGTLGIGLGAGVMARMGRRLEAARHRAEAADTAKSRFLATMSHELRTPLNAVLGFSQVMEQRMFGDLGNPKYEEYVRDIRRGGEHLLGLINDVLDLSKIEAGRFTLDERPLSLGDAVAEALELMREQAHQGGLRMESDIQPNMPDLMANARAVRQMLLNLLGNAIRFTPTGGRILVSANVGEHGGQSLMVSDTGAGIPEDQIERVLEPFHQAPTQLRLEGGTGLGLALVKAFIGLHGGTLALCSRVDVGTSVTLRFPPVRSMAVTRPTRVPGMGDICPGGSRAEVTKRSSTPFSGLASGHG